MTRVSTASALLRRAALVFTAAFTLAAAAQPAAARCHSCDESTISEPETLRVSFPSPSGGRFVVRRVVLLTGKGAFAARMPERARAQNEDRLDVRGAIGDAAGLGRLFPRPLTAYVEPELRVGVVYSVGDVLYVDLSQAGDTAADRSLRGGIALLTRTPFRNRLYGLRIPARFEAAHAPTSVGRPVGDAYLTSSGLLLSPPVSALPRRW